MANNIEMNYKESDGSYKILWPVNDSFTKIQTLNTLVCDVMGISVDSTPADAFLSLALGLNSYGYYLTFMYPENEPASGLNISGVTGINGEALTTDENGQVLAVSESQTITFSVSAPKYFDLQTISNRQVQSTGKVTNVVIEFEQKTGDYQLVTSSQNAIQFSQIVNFLDFTVVGAGGGGAGYRHGAGTGNNSGCTGGGGGYVESLQSYNNEGVFQIQIGGGGAGGGVVTASGGLPMKGGTGGNTVLKNDGVQLLLATGGSGGPEASTGSALGNGRGGSEKSRGGNGVGNLFDDSSLMIAGGGGGSGGNPGHGTISGGLPYGGDSGTRGKGVGGGGGGSVGAVNAGNGYPGGVYIRWHNKT